MAKKPKNSIPEEVWSKNGVVDFKQFRDLYGHSKEKTLKYLKLLAEDIVLWAKTKSKTSDFDQSFSYTLEEYYLIEKGIPPTTWESWLRMSDELDAAAKWARYVLGLARERGVMFKKMDAQFVSNVQRYYSPVWERVAQINASEKEKNAVGGTFILADPNNLIPKE